MNCLKKLSIFRMVIKMILEEDLCILNSEEYYQETTDFFITEKDKKNGFIMDLKVNLKEKSIYNLFCKIIKGRKEDSCKLLFMSFQNFPDGIYLEINEGDIICHIVELKKNPQGKLPNIGMQFMSAEYHIRSLFSIMEIDFSTVKMFYYVGFIKDDISKVDEFNRKSTSVKKVIPGVKQEKPKRIIDWENSIVSACIGKYNFRKEVIKVKLNFVEQRNGLDYFFEEITFT